MPGALARLAAAKCDNQAAQGLLVAMDELHKASQEFHDRVEEPLWIAQLQKLSDVRSDAEKRAVKIRGS